LLNHVYQIIKLSDDVSASSSWRKIVQSNLPHTRLLALPILEKNISFRPDFFTHHDGYDITSS